MVLARRIARYRVGREGHVSMQTVSSSATSAPGKVVRVQGIRSELQTPFSPLLLTANRGRVWIEDGVFEPAHEPFPGATFGSTGVFMTTRQTSPPT